MSVWSRARLAPMICFLLLATCQKQSGPPVSSVEGQPEKPMADKPEGGEEQEMAVGDPGPLDPPKPSSSLGGGSGSAENEAASPPLVGWREMSEKYPNVLWYSLPTKEWEEKYQEERFEGVMNQWLRRYERMLSKLNRPPNAPTLKAPKKVFLMRYNAPKMSWFLTTPNVDSYEEQLEIAKKFLKGTHRFHVTLPCKLQRPIGQPGGTDVDCDGVFYTRWFEQVPEEWEGCQSENVPSDRNVVRTGPPGMMRRMLHWTAEMHLTVAGQVDKFKFTRAEGPDYTVKPGEDARCFEEPHWNHEEPSVKSWPLKHGDILHDMEKNVFCSAPHGSRWMTAARFDGKECWVDTWSLTSAPDNATP